MKLRILCLDGVFAAGGDFDSIAGQVVYADASTLRNLPRRKLGRGVRELRAEMR